MVKWPVTTFEKLYEIPSRNGLSKPSRVRGSGYKMINMGELFANDRIYDINMELVPLTDIEKEKAKILPFDLLFARQSLVAAGAGKCSIVMETSDLTVFESHLIRVRLNKLIADPFFYYYYFRSSCSPMQTIIQHCVQAGIKASDLSKLEVVVPPLCAQRKISSVLMSIDKKIEENKKINKNLEHQAEAIFQSILSNAITTVNLGKIADVKGGKRLPNGVNLIDIPNTHPYIRVRDLNNVLFASLTPDYAYVDEETQKSISRYIVSTGDVLISIVGTIGLTAIVDSTLDKANLTENCVKVTNLKHITPEYLLLYLRSQSGREAITKGTVGAVQQKLPIKNIQAIPIPLLSERDKTTLFCTLDSIFDEISSNVIQSTKLVSLRDTLLPKLMSCELDVSAIDL